ncbi:MAG: HAD-IIA family hydrolase [Micromonosporaceae bacterium]|nr:HAD-IIA family hydrolase [Micromonosporaceae bacterium]
MNRADDLVSGYDLVIFDLDGVLYVGRRSVPWAAKALMLLRGRQQSVIFATNNASRTAETVAELLESVGIPAVVEEVLTSARATAAVLAECHPAGSSILVVGSPALEEEVSRVGLRPVRTAEDRPVAVVQGYGPEVGWAALAEATVAIRAGAEWVATNADRTLPSPRGPLPGNGAMVAALATALDRAPDRTVGKPDPGLFHQAVALTGAHRPLAVGDRLDTDIEGAVRAGMDSLLVLTGVSRPVDALLAPPGLRPTYVAEGLDGLFEVRPEATRPISDASVGGWAARVDDRSLVLEGQGTPIDALRALCGCAWAAWDERGLKPAAVPLVTAAGPSAREALSALALG